VNNNHLITLAALLRKESDALMADWRSEIRQLEVAKHLDIPTLNDHVPDLIEELACELEACSDETVIEGLKDNPAIHGLDRLELGFDVEEVVGEYNALRGVILNLIEAHDLQVKGLMNHTINRVIDKSIGLAVKTYATQKALEVQQRREEHLSFVAHDLRAPLSTISIAAQLLENRLPNGASDEPTANLLATLGRNVTRLNELIVKVIQEENNLNADPNERARRRDVELKPLVDGLMRDLDPMAVSSDAKLFNQIPAEIIVFADPNLLTLVFQNLISNAISYTPHGNIIVGARQDPEANAVECWVSDNGAGIPSGRTQKVFEKLVTDPDRNAGMGLGLAIVRQFVEAHGGNVSVDSVVGVGSTFRFNLPNRGTSNEASLAVGKT
jgi:two-component system, OmpR family, phosphate regulon sensor histidine kinase PhoR